MMPVERGHSFGRDPVVVPSALLRDCREEPPLFDPVDDFCGANVDGLSQGLRGKAVAPDFANAQLPSVEGIAKGLGTSL